METIFLKKLLPGQICAIGERINQFYKDDLRYVRTTVCENSYVEIKTDKGYSIMSDLKNEFDF